MIFRNRDTDTQPNVGRRIGRIMGIRNQLTSEISLHKIELINKASNYLSYKEVRKYRPSLSKTTEEFNMSWRLNLFNNKEKISQPQNYLSTIAEFSNDPVALPSAPASPCLSSVTLKDSPIYIDLT